MTLLKDFQQSCYCLAVHYLITARVRKLEPQEPAFIIRARRCADDFGGIKDGTILLSSSFHSGREGNIDTEILLRQNRMLRSLRRKRSLLAGTNAEEFVADTAF